MSSTYTLIKATIFIQRAFFLIVHDSQGRKNINIVLLILKVAGFCWHFFQFSFGWLHTKKKELFFEVGDFLFRYNYLHIIFIERMLRMPTLWISDSISEMNAGWKANRGERGGRKPGRKLRSLFTQKRFLLFFLHFWKQWVKKCFR